MEDQIAEHLDIVILGAGVSGLNTAHLLAELLPHRRVTILEARPVLGGTWNLFQYPGFRSDSYMTTFGFRWFPWPHSHKVSSATDISAYLEDAARADGSFSRIRFRHQVTDCQWRDEDQFWRLRLDVDGAPKTMAARFVFACTGYYSYRQALAFDIPGLDQFAGTVVHPQWWPADLNYAGKRVVVVGSGATAFTLIPALAPDALEVTMLQRSPSDAYSISTRSSFDGFLRALLPAAIFHTVTYWKDLLFEIIATQFLLTFPNVSRSYLKAKARQQLPPDCDVDVHFNPRYNPFQQRLCLCPDGDFFKVLHRENCHIVTDQISTVTSDGILLKSGRKLPADIIVTATGLYFEIMNGMHPVVNGKPIDPGSHYTWRGTMLESLPNLGYVLGYVTQSWTPGADAMARTLIRVVQRMEQKQATKVMPVLERWEGMPRKLAVNANSSYFLKAADRMPKTTGQGPWYGRTNWIRDIWALWFGDMDEGLEYSGKEEAKKEI